MMNLKGLKNQSPAPEIWHFPYLTIRNREKSAALIFPLSSGSFSFESEMIWTVSASSSVVSCVH